MNTPFSVHMVVALEWLLSGLLGFYALMFLVFGFYGILHFNLSRILTSLGVALLVTAIGGGIFFIGRALRDGNKWA